MISMKSKKVQTGLRLDPGLLERLKMKARAEHKTFNGYVEGLLEKALEPVFPNRPRKGRLSHVKQQLTRQWGIFPRD